MKTEIEASVNDELSANRRRFKISPLVESQDRERILRSHRIHFKNLTPRNQQIATILTIHIRLYAFTPINTYALHCINYHDTCIHDMWYDKTPLIRAYALF